MFSQDPWALQKNNQKPSNTKKHQNVLALETKQKKNEQWNKTNEKQIIHVPFHCPICFPIYVKARLFAATCSLK